MLLRYKIVKYEGKNPVKSKVKISSRFAQFSNKRNFTVPPWFRKKTDNLMSLELMGLSVFKRERYLRKLYFYKSLFDLPSDRSFSKPWG